MPKIVETAGSAPIILPMQKLINDTKVIALKLKNTPPGVFIELVRTIEGRCVAINTHYASGAQQIAIYSSNGVFANNKTPESDIKVLSLEDILVEQSAGKKYISEGTFVQKPRASSDDKAKDDSKPAPTGALKPQVAAPVVTK